MACKLAKASAREKKVHGVLTGVVRCVVLPRIARGTMQTPLHPHFLPKKCLMTKKNERKNMEVNLACAKAGRRPFWCIA